MEVLKKMSQVKNNNIAQCNALNNSLSMVTALSNMSVLMVGESSTKDQIKDWLLVVKQSEYEANCKLLGIVAEPQL